MAGLLSSLFGGSKPTAMPTAQPMSPEAQYLQNMQRLSQGDVSSVLTGGDKLLALSALLGSVARGSRTTPQEVMSQVQQQAQSRIGSQMQLAQLQAKAEQDRKQKAFIAQFASTLPEGKKGVLENMDTAEAFKVVSQEAFRPKQVQQIVRDAEGNTRITYQDGTSQVADWKLPAKTEYKDIGDKLVLVDSDSGKPITDANGNQQSLPKNLSPYEVQSLALRRQEMAQSAANARRTAGASERGQLVQTDTGFAVWGPKSQTLRPLPTTLKPKAKADPYGFSGILSGTGSPRYGGQ